VTACKRLSTFHDERRRRSAPASTSSRRDSSCVRDPAACGAGKQSPGAVLVLDSLTAGVEWPRPVHDAELELADYLGVDASAEAIVADRARCASRDCLPIRGGSARKNSPLDARRVRRGGSCSEDDARVPRTKRRCSEIVALSSPGGRLAFRRGGDPLTQVGMRAQHAGGRHRLANAAATRCTPAHWGGLAVRWERRSGQPHREVSPEALAKAYGRRLDGHRIHGSDARRGRAHRRATGWGASGSGDAGVASSRSRRGNARTVGQWTATVVKLSGG